MSDVVRATGASSALKATLDKIDADTVLSSAGKVESVWISEKHGMWRKGIAVLEAYPGLADKKNLPKGGRGVSGGFMQVERATGRQAESIAKWVNLALAHKTEKDLLAWANRESKLVVDRWRASMSLPSQGVAENHRALGTHENEWYTPAQYVEAARQVMGEIDLDPASNAQAQRWIKAKQFFTKEQNGLDKQWIGRVWLNPPYAQPAIAHFCEKMVEEFKAGRVVEAVMLTHNYTDTSWFHLAESACTALCFTRGRIKFVDPSGDVCAPTQGQAFFYYGDRPQVFAEVFRNVGFVR